MIPHEVPDEHEYLCSPCFFLLCVAHSVSVYVFVSRSCASARFDVVYGMRFGLRSCANYLTNIGIWVVCDCSNKEQHGLKGHWYLLDPGQHVPPCPLPTKGIL